MKFSLIIAMIAGLQVATAAPAVKTLGDLRKIEEKVQTVVAENTAATISLQSMRRDSSGSGVIISKEGLILTAAHVVSGSQEMVVIFPDGREERAKVLGQNHTRDAAMAQLIGEGPWPFVEVGESDSLETGDIVVAMGHPLGYDPTRRPPVRFGRVMTQDATDFITTDCTVIGGDSGGPLFDLEGRLIGIHSHINIAKREVNRHAGISGFEKSWDKMKEGEIWGILGDNGNGRNRPVLGVLIENEASPLTVLSLPEGSPAKKAGIRAGDVLLKIDETKLDSLKDLRLFLIDHQPGDVLNVSVQRGEEILEMKVTLAGLRGY